MAEKYNGDGLRTPDWLYKALDREFQFKLDVAADRTNTKCVWYLSKEDDALESTCNWAGGPCWCNPPYSKPHIPQFLRKAYEESQAGSTVVVLVPLDPTDGWSEWVVDKAAEVRVLVPGRVKFLNPDGTPTPNTGSKASCVVVYRPRYAGRTHVSFVRKADLMAGASDD